MAVTRHMPHRHLPYVFDICQGCFTNVDRTCHISYKAIEPPGECKSDLQIFLDYSRRMNFKDSAVREC